MNIMQWFCRAIKVSFEKKLIFSLNKVKKSFTGLSVGFFFVMQVIGNE